LSIVNVVAGSRCYAVIIRADQFCNYADYGFGCKLGTPTVIVSVIPVGVRVWLYLRVGVPTDTDKLIPEGTSV